MQTSLTLIVFALTLLGVFLRPWRLNEAWFTVAGGSAMLVLGLVSSHQATQIVYDGREALLFLLGLLVLSDLMRASGFFEWAAIHAARSSRGRGSILYRNIFILGFLVTALLSLDTTAVMLTPVVLALVGRLKLTARPFLFVCAFVANTGSLLLPVSNLTNLLFVSAFRWSFGAFTAWMVLPQLFSLVANYWLFRRLFASSLPSTFDVEGLPLPMAPEVVPDVRFFRASVCVFALVVFGYFIGPAVRVPPYTFAMAGAFALYLWGLRLGRVSLGLLREVSWPVFPFVIGLFVVVRAMENLGLAALVSQSLARGAQSPLLTVVIGVFGAGLGSNVVNNIPMALLSISSLHAGNDLSRFAALVGCNLGPNLTVAGSLATMLVIASARRQGEDVGAKDFFRVGLVATPLLLSAGCLGLFAASVFLST